MEKKWTGNHRASWHDYTQRQIYHITLKKRRGVMSFGTLAGDWRLSEGSFGSSYICASPLGTIIKTCIKDFKTIHPALRIYQYALMPDHLHLLLSVEESLDEILGRKLAMFKVMVNKRANLESVFEKGFNDQILTANRDLNVIYDYLRSNPYRLAVRRANPEFFTRCNSLTIGDTQCQLYGNIHLLRNPFKEQVVVHRSDSRDIINGNIERWAYTSANGGVLVSPFISRYEKEIRVKSEALGAKLILITHTAFKERFKPSAHDYNLCVTGRLLIVSLGLSPGTTLSRDHCLRMNALARTIAEM